MHRATVVQAPIKPVVFVGYRERQQIFANIRSMSVRQFESNIDSAEVLRCKQRAETPPSHLHDALQEWKNIHHRHPFFSLEALSTEDKLCSASTYSHGTSVRSIRSSCSTTQFVPRLQSLSLIRRDNGGKCRRHRRTEELGWDGFGINTHGHDCMMHQDDDDTYRFGSPDAIKKVGKLIPNWMKRLIHTLIRRYEWYLLGIYGLLGRRSASSESRISSTEC